MGNVSVEVITSGFLCRHLTLYLGFFLASPLLSSTFFFCLLNNLLHILLLYLSHSLLPVFFYIWIVFSGYVHSDSSTMKPCYCNSSSMQLSIVLLKYARASQKKLSSRWDYMLLWNLYIPLSTFTKIQPSITVPCILVVLSRGYVSQCTSTFQCNSNSLLYSHQSDNNPTKI